MTRLLSRVAAVVILTLVLAQAARAQETDAINHPLTKAGSAAMLFEFGGLSSMGFDAIDLADLFYPGEGGPDFNAVFAAGGKYYISDDLALRVLLGFSTKTSGADTLQQGKTTQTIVGIGAGVEMHTRAVYAISPYFGGQIQFASASSDNVAPGEVAHGKFDPQAVTTTETKRSASSFGIGVFAGFDWYVMKSIAIGGEYTLGFSTASASQTVGSAAAQNEPSTTVIGIGSGSVHLAVHF